MLYLRIRGKGCLIYCFIIDLLKSRYFDFGKSLEDGDKKAYSTWIIGARGAALIR